MQIAEINFAVLVFFSEGIMIVAMPVFLYIRLTESGVHGESDACAVSGKVPT